jgi:hypothetical protein
MGTSPNSQWDFGELFPAEATRKVLPVSELTAQVKRLLEKQVGSVWVNGEITIKWILTLSSCPSNPVAGKKFTTHSRTQLGWCFTPILDSDWCENRKKRPRWSWARNQMGNVSLNSKQPMFIRSCYNSWPLTSFCLCLNCSGG